MCADDVQNAPAAPHHPASATIGDADPGTTALVAAEVSARQLLRQL